MPALGRIVDIHSGEDGVVRTVTVKMNAGIIKTIGKMSMFTSN